MTEDLSTFIAHLTAIATESADKLDAGTDLISELEVSALLAAAQAYATYTMARALRRSVDAYNATEIN